MQGEGANCWRPMWGSLDPIGFAVQQIGFGLLSLFFGRKRGEAEAEFCGGNQGGGRRSRSSTGELLRLSLGLGNCCGLAFGVAVAAGDVLLF